ncbi:hypothetical protein CRG98_037615 [Punica granatum]|uniref:Uncharacterized protein n=1 Tax=Punica granatum TaxID=22663 RepID=A0A2I0IDD0_PUNGR|nr:hypothetical protein CRG98_037615 [Punica granatum]
MTPNSWGSLWPAEDGLMAKKTKLTRLAEKGRGEKAEPRRQEEKGRLRILQRARDYERRGGWWSCRKMMMVMDLSSGR